MMVARVLGYEPGVGELPIETAYSDSRTLDGGGGPNLHGEPGPDEMPVVDTPMRPPVPIEDTPSVTVGDRPAVVNTNTMFGGGDYVDLLNRRGMFMGHEIHLDQTEFGAVCDLLAHSVARQLREEMERVLKAVQQPEREGLPVSAPGSGGIQQVPEVPAEVK
jgi:hypothetical protein